MTDNVEKKITIALSGKDDGASATLDKVIGKGNDLERTFKKVGKISGIGGFKVASDVAEGLSGELGAIGRYAGITAGVAGSVLAVNKITAAVDGAVAKIQSGEIAWGEFTNEIVKGLPLIGTIQKGLQDTAEIISGVKFAMRDAEAKAKQIDERKAVIDTNREYVFGIVREANKKADPAKAIREELDGELNYLKQILDAKFIDEERYQYARREDMRFTSFSMAKTVTAVMIGQLVADGRLRLDEGVPIPAWQRSGEGDEEKLLDTLRRAHHAEVFRTLVRDVEGELTVEQVADDLSALADAVLDCALRWAWPGLKQRHREAPQFAIIAYGSFTVEADGKWNYKLADHQELAQGESHTETYTVTVKDEFGAKTSIGYLVFKIAKEEASSSGVRRIKAILVK